jgi:hypothetical protein
MCADLERDNCSSAGREHGSGGDPDPSGHPSLKASLDNWRDSPLSFPEKLALAARNTMIKMRRRQSCCGHHGEPGC